MSVEAELKRIIKSLEILNQAISAQRSATNQQCKVIQSLFKPWSSTKPKDLSAAKTTEQQFKEDRDVGKAEPEQTVVELCPELEKIERLLTKVQKVRSTVKDEEVMDVCHIKPEDIKLPAPKAVTSEKAVPSQSKSITPRPMTSGKGRRVLQAMNSYQTTYQSSFKTTKSTKPDIRVKTTVSRSSSQSCGKKATTAAMTSATTAAAAKNSISNTEETKASSSKSPSADTQTMASVSTDFPEFNLLTQGKELKIPKAMKQVMTRHKTLRLAADSIIRSPTKSSMPSKLANYYESLQSSSPAS